MKLKEFIKKLRKIAKERGNNLNVIMADNIPVVNPKSLKRRFFGRIVLANRLLH